jgi:hypothetical protein
MSGGLPSARSAGFATISSGWGHFTNPAPSHKATIANVAQKLGPAPMRFREPQQQPQDQAYG